MSANAKYINIYKRRLTESRREDIIQEKTSKYNLGVKISGRNNKLSFVCLLVPISTNTLIPACQSASTCFVCVFVITAPSLGCVFVFGMQTKKTPLPLDLVQNNPEKPMDGTTSICSRADACQLSGGIASGTRVYSPSVFTKEKKICCNCFIKVLHTGKHDGQLVSRGKK